MLSREDLITVSDVRSEIEVLNMKMESVSSDSEKQISVLKTQIAAIEQTRDKNLQAIQDKISTLTSSVKTIADKVEINPK